MNAKKIAWVTTANALLGAATAFGALIGGEDISLGAESFLNQAPASQPAFVSGGATFKNTFTDFGGGFTAWSGYSLSSITGNTIDQSDIDGQLFFGYQYANAAGTAAGGSNYWVAYAGASGDALITLPSGLDQPISLQLTNSLYSWASMTYGDDFAKKFGGADGTDPDFLRLTIRGLDSDGLELNTIEYYLADFRSGNPLEDYIISDWQEVNLSSLGTGIAALDFVLDSSDNGSFGMNTPAYFAIDNLVVVPEPATTVWLISVITAICIFSRRSLFSKGLK